MQSLSGSFREFYALFIPSYTSFSEPWTGREMSYFTPKTHHMTISDLQLIGKKVAVGIVVATVPLVILLGGLWLIQNVLSDDPSSPSTKFILNK